MNSIQLLAPNHSLENKVNVYMRPFHTATCQEHLIGALQQLPKSPTFPREESSIREQVAIRLLQEVIVMGAQEQEALDDCLVACGPLEALSACATTLQEIAARNNPKSKKKKKKAAASSSSVESPSILETALRTIRRWLVKGVSFPPDIHHTNSHEERCWVEQVTTTLSHHMSQYNTDYYKINANKQNHQRNNNNEVHSPLIQACLENLTKLVLMFPVQISNACHALGVQLPTWAIAARYNPRLIEGALSMALYQQETEGTSYSAYYFKLLVQHMVRNRNPDDVALGLYKYHERHYRSRDNNNSNSNSTPPSHPKALCHLLLQLHRHTLSPRESAYLLRSIMISSIPRQSHATKIATTQLTEMWQRHLYPYMELSCRPILVASRRVREAFVRLLVLSPSSVLNEEWPDRLLCHCAASLLANPVPLISGKKSDKTRSTAGTNDSEYSSTDSSSDDEDDSSDDSSNDSDSEDDSNDKHNKDEAIQHHAWLAKHVQEVISTWSLSVFVRQTEYGLQRHVTNFLLSGMCFLQLQHDETTVGATGASKDSPFMSELISGLLEGVTVRLESSIPTIRKDGMMVAERLAQKMGQELQFDELEQERSLGEDDEVTFLQSVMTASEFPSHYYGGGRKAPQSEPPPQQQPPPSRLMQSKPPQPPSRLLQSELQQPPSRLLQQRREQQAAQYAPQSERKQKNTSSKKKEKEERRKRRKAKKEGKSDTRILDAVYGQLTSSSAQQQETKRGNRRNPRDSYEDSYTEVPDNNESAAPEQDKPKTRTSCLSPTTFQLPNLTKSKASQASRTAMPNTSRNQWQPSRQESGEGLQHNHSKFDSYDNSSILESQVDDTVKAHAPPPRYTEEQAKVDVLHSFDYPVPKQRGFSHSHGHGVPQQPSLHYGSEQYQNTYHPGENALHPPHHDNPNLDYHRQEQQLRPQSQHFAPQNYSQPMQSFHSQEYGRRQDSFAIQQHPPPVYPQEQEYQPDSMDFLEQDEEEEEEEEEIDFQRGIYAEDRGQHVTWENTDYIIPEPEEVQQEMYWQNQKKQQRRQRHYQQQQAVERQLEKELKLQKEQRKREKELQQQVTMKITSPTPSYKDTKDIPETPKPSKERDAEQGQSPRRRMRERSRPITPVVTTVDEESLEVTLTKSEEVDDSGVAACWTQQEVEMVLENDPPRHSPLSPLPLALSPNPNSPKKSPTKSGSPRQTPSSRRAEPAPNARELPSSSSEREGDVPSLIFAMVDGEDNGDGEKKEAQNEATVKADTAKRVTERRNKGKETIEDDSMLEMEEKRLNGKSTPRGKPPLSPRSRYNSHQQQQQGSSSPYPSRQQKGSSMSSTGTSNQKDSFTTSRSRIHPSVDPAEIDARILAAAYDHESTPSTNSAPSLSVCSSSSGFSLTLNEEQGKNGGSQRATRQPKPAYSNAYEHMKRKFQYRRNQEDPQKQPSPIVKNEKSPKASNKRVQIVDPDAPFESDDDEEETYDEYYDDEYYDDEEEAEDDYRTRSRSTDDDYDYTEGSYTNDEEYDDEDSAWDESENRHLDAYDVEDDEEDLLETPKPRYLRDCLELLRAPESDKSAYSKHGAALKWLPTIVQGKEKPADLPDLAVPLALELMRMENKFNIDTFEDDRLISVIALVSEEPLAVGQRLILLLWEDIAFMDRLDVLTILSEAAFELSGNKKLEEWNKEAATKNRDKQTATGTNGKRAYVKENYSILSCKDNSTMTGTDMGSVVSAHAERALGQVESKTRRWGRGRRQPDMLSIRSKFGPVAHVWYYSLVGGFLQRKDNSALWGGAVGARLLANMFVTLATIVECAGAAPGTDVLAKDLFELVWSFRTVDVAEVRMGVLVAIAASLSCLSEEVVLTMMFDGSFSSLPEGLKQMSQLDPDVNCRRLASSMSRGISGIVDSLQPMGKVSKLSFEI